jgi:electron-transferring-flavoprotein dehydrogenase
VTDDRFYFLGHSGSIRVPNFIMPPLMSNHGNYIASLGNVCRWLGQQAEALGVEVYPGFPAADLVFGDDGRVLGVTTGDLGVAKDGHHKPDFTPGMNLLGKYTLFAEGARGSLSKRLDARFKLHEGREPQKFGIGLKELWELAPGKHKRGLVLHTMGWPLDNKTGGGVFMYHWGENLCSVGFVVHLNYQNPYLSPFDEFQRVKHHPRILEFLEGGKRIGYGARAITEGGFQSVPKLVFPGGALIGCSAGFVNVPRIKGSHNAMKTGMLAADAVFAALGEGRSGDVLDGYEAAYEASHVYTDLKRVRNVKPLWSKFGTVLGVGLGGIDMWMNQLFGFSLFGTLKHGKADYQTLKKAADCKPIAYPKPDGVISFDKLSSVFVSNTNHEYYLPVTWF